jgi:hypothetical protein
VADGVTGAIGSGREETLDYRPVLVAGQPSTAYYSLRMPKPIAGDRRWTSVQVTRLNDGILPLRLIQYRLAAIRPQMSERRVSCLLSWTFRFTQ